ncbi:hypothetical protein [Tranquillimonas alkanivorans]|uniref:hypothetical protein n=1 Tax=Tranquillimonas alkanivorans TaxID=441119 RepID=UPI0015A60440|nr:hypothetical protein [Tranquillimonas alkanivorans]
MLDIFGRGAGRSGGLVHDLTAYGALLMVWRDTSAVGNLRTEILGDPPREIIDGDGVLLVRRK